MALGPGLQLRPTQSLVMSQQLQAAIKLLALSNLELEAVIGEEVAKNPLLEVQSSGEGVIVGVDRETGEDGPDPAGSDELLAKGDDSGLDIDWQAEALNVDSATDVAGGAGDDGFDFDRLETRERSLCEHLLAQLHGAGGPAGRAAEAIVQELEETGYLETPLATLAEAIGAGAAEVEAGLRLVQSLDPPGIAARSLEECLALQAKAADRYDPAMVRLIANLDLLARGRLTDLKRICGVDDDDLRDMIAELRSYDPKPGCRFARSDDVPAGEPDVLVRRTRDGWAVELNPANLPRVLVNRRYHAELKRGAADKPSRAWLSECLASAGWLVKALDQRARTITRVATEIIRRQSDFFERGVAGLKPLTLREVAEAIEMHESTVSRVTQNKLLLCDRGLFELKYFFGSGIAAADGEAASAAAVKAAIARLVESEREILSDDAIAAALNAEGYDIARRTVVKYREAMGIGSSIERRRHRKMMGR